MIEHVGHQRLGAFNTSDIETAYEELRSRGVTFHTEPTEHPYGIDATFEDLYGNWADLVEPVY
jgi:predicted enzyme related to lactoylglutathione lyase